VGRGLLCVRGCCVSFCFAVRAWAWCRACGWRRPASEADIATQPRRMVCLWIRRGRPVHGWRPRGSEAEIDWGGGAADGHAARVRGACRRRRGPGARPEREGGRPRDPGTRSSAGDYTCKRRRGRTRPFDGPAVAGGPGWGGPASEAEIDAEPACEPPSDAAGGASGLRQRRNGPRDPGRPRSMRDCVPGAREAAAPAGRCDAERDRARSHGAGGAARRGRPRGRLAGGCAGASASGSGSAEPLAVDCSWASLRMGSASESGSGQVEPLAVECAWASFGMGSASESEMLGHSASKMSSRSVRSGGLAGTCFGCWVGGGSDEVRGVGCGGRGPGVPGAGVLGVPSGTWVMKLMAVPSCSWGCAGATDLDPRSQRFKSPWPRALPPKLPPARSVPLSLPPPRSPCVRLPQGASHRGVGGSTASHGPPSLQLSCSSLPPSFFLPRRSTVALFSVPVSASNAI
jgi:hypothetical protein